MASAHLLAVLAFSAAAGAVFAQTPATASAAPKAAVCTKPDPFPGKLASDNAKRAWQKEVASWQECMKKYVNEMQTEANNAVKAANTAIDEYNTAAREFQKQVDAAKDQ
jgi:hypothetical protein